VSLSANRFDLRLQELDRWAEGIERAALLALCKMGPAAAHALRARQASWSSEARLRLAAVVGLTAKLERDGQHKLPWAEGPEVQPLVPALQDLIHGGSAEVREVAVWALGATHGTDDSAPR
jgi:hypothetical protein